jgi:hypothetical protein
MVAMTNCSWVFKEHEQRNIREIAIMASLFPVSTAPAVRGAFDIDVVVKYPFPIVEMHAVEGM